MKTVMLEQIEKEITYDENSQILERRCGSGNIPSCRRKGWENLGGWNNANGCTGMYARYDAYILRPITEEEKLITFKFKVELQENSDQNAEFEIKSLNENRAKNVLNNHLEDFNKKINVNGEELIFIKEKTKKIERIVSSKGYEEFYGFVSSKLETGFPTYVPSLQPNLPQNFKLLNSIKLIKVHAEGFNSRHTLFQNVGPIGKARFLAREHAEEVAKKEGYNAVALLSEGEKDKENLQWFPVLVEVK